MVPGVTETGRFGVTTGVVFIFGFLIVWQDKVGHTGDLE